MTTQKPEPVAVEQGDRDAAMQTIPDDGSHSSYMMVDAISSGRGDDWPLVQAFAAHRLAERARLTTDRSVGVEAREIERLTRALSDVVNPLAVLQRRADADGARLSGAAYGIANDLGFVQAIARDALAATPPVPAISETGEPK